MSFTELAESSGMYFDEAFVKLTTLCFLTMAYAITEPITITNSNHGPDCSSN